MNIEEGFKKINGIEIYYKIVGSGEPLLILHGGPGLAHNYLYKHFSQLSEKYKVIFFDQRSNGKSTGDENPNDISIDNLILDIEELRKSFNIAKLNILGQSFGGLLALNYAVKYPDRIKTLSILESAGASSDFMTKFQENINLKLTEESKKELSETKKELNTINNSKGIAPVLIRYLSIINRLYFYNTNFMKHLDMSYFDDDMARKLFIIQDKLRNYTSNYNILNQLSKITCPTLIIHGEDDLVPYQEIEKIHKAINGSEFYLLKDCGHFAHIEKSLEYFQIINDFLSKNLKN